MPQDKEEKIGVLVTVVLEGLTPEQLFGEDVIKRKSPNAFSTGNSERLAVCGCCNFLLENVGTLKEDMFVCRHCGSLFLAKKEAGRPLAFKPVYQPGIIYPVDVLRELGVLPQRESAESQ